MRLTLRYLLAYLDDYLLPHGSRKILEPEDFETIGRKIDESDFAKSLVERIRDVVRRGRLGAPSEEDREGGLDANTVAEYLDNALPDAQVPDFEKVCLESDVHLAEVACCHQVLAMVVTEPVEVDDQTRQEIYQLPDALDQEAQIGEPSLPVEDLPEEPGDWEESEQPQDSPRSPRERHKAVHRSSVPEYFPSGRGSGRRASGLAVAGFLALVVLVALLIPIGESGNLLSRLWAWRTPEVAPEAEEVSGPSATGPSPVAPANDAKAGPPAASAKAGGPSGESAQPGSPPSAGKAAEAEKSATPSKPAPKAPSPAAKGAPARAAASQGTAADKPLPQPPKPSPPAGSAAAPDGGEAAGSPPMEPKAERLAPRPENIQTGLMASTKQLLLRLSPKTGTWQRVADETALFGNDRILSLPAFRPRLALAGRTTVEFADATKLTLLPPAGNGPFGIAVEFGRILAKADEAGGSSLRIVAGDHSGVCQFADADSIAAIEVSRTEAGAGDPETQPGPLAIDLYVTSGSVVWRDDQAGKEIPLRAPKRLSVSEQPLESVLLQQLPRWISPDSVDPLDERAAPLVEREVTLGRSVVLSLRPLTSHQRIEVRRLAMRSLSLVDDFEPLLIALDDPDEYRFWPQHIEELREAVFRGPQAAAGVRKAMEERYGPQGAELYEMLWKYRPDAVGPEDANRLVDYLGHGALAFRVLGLWNLKNLYPNRTLNYRPDDPPPKRQIAIQKWRDMLKVSPGPRGVPAPLPQPPPTEREE